VVVLLSRYGLRLILWGGGGEGRIIEKGAYNIGSNDEWFLTFNNTWALVFARGFDGTSLYVTSVNNIIRPNTWHHVFLTWDGSTSASEVHIYIDDAEVSYSGKQNGVGNKGSDAAQTLLVGNDTGSRLFDGIMDDLRIYNRVLSADEVSALYKLGEGTHVNVTPDIPNDPLAQGLVGHWTFDGPDMNWASTTAEVLDRSGNNNHGNAVNGVGISSVKLGKIGQALAFDDIDDYVLVPDADSLDFGTGDFSISAWIKPNEYDNVHYVLAKGSTLSTGYGFFMQNTYRRMLSILAQQDTGLFYHTSYSYSIPEGEWAHVSTVVTHNTGTEIIFFVNGSFAGSFSTSTILNVSNSSTLKIGQDSDGSLDDLRMYNRALSPDEVSALYKLGEGTHINVTPDIPNDPLAVGLVGHWTFDGPDMNWASTTAEVLDRSENNNRGDILNGAKATIGKVGQGLQFDGVGNYTYIKVATSSVPATLSKITVSGWVNGESFSAYKGIFEVEGVFKVRNSFDLNRLVFSASAWTTPGDWAGGVLSTSIWHHFVFTYDYDQPVGTKPIFYLDGVLTSVAKGVDAVGNYTLPATAPSFIGAVNLSSIPRVWIGKLDDIRVYNRVLSPDEISELYRRGAGQ